MFAQPREQSLHRASICMCERVWEVTICYRYLSWIMFRSFDTFPKDECIVSQLQYLTAWEMSVPSGRPVAGGRTSLCSTLTRFVKHRNSTTRNNPCMNSGGYSDWLKFTKHGQSQKAKTDLTLLNTSCMGRYLKGYHNTLNTLFE